MSTTQLNNAARMFEEGDFDPSAVKVARPDRSALLDQFKDNSASIVESSPEGEEPEMGVYDMAQAASFFEGNFGEKAFLHYNQLRAQELHGEYSRNNGGGAITVVNGIDEKEEKEKEELEKFKDAWGGDDKPLSQKEWEGLGDIDVGNGVTMDAKDIDHVLSLLGTKQGKQSFIDAYKKKTGANDKDAKKVADETQRYMDLIKKREMHQPLTDDDKKFLNDFPQTAEGKAAIETVATYDKKTNNFNLDTIAPTTRANEVGIKSLDNDALNDEAFYSREKVNEPPKAQTKDEAGIKTDISLKTEWKNSLAATQPLDKSAAPAIAQEIASQNSKPSIANDLSAFG